MRSRSSRKHRHLGRSLALVGVVLGVGALASPGCGNSGLVGGACAQGLTNCSNSCVNLDSDQYNCGHCGHVCQSGVACISGKCGGMDDVGGAGYGGNGGDGNHYRDGAAGDGQTSSDATGDRINEFDVTYPQGGSAGSSSTGGASSSGGTSSGGTSRGGSAGTDSGDANACNPPYNDALHCGDCITVCPAESPVCAPSAGSYECRPFCDSPLVNCNGTCADLNSDPANCGTCGNDCPSGACQAGACVGVQPGHFVAICMNYRTPPGLQTTLLLGNSIFLPHVATVRILAYGEYADAAVRQQVDSTIAAAAAQPPGRQFSIVQVNSSADVPTLLSKSNYDVFLVYEQPNAPPGELSNIGSLWASSLQSFSYVGGVIVMLDGAQGVREMAPLITSTRLFSVDDEVGLSSTTLLVNRVYNDAVGTGVYTPLTCQDDTCVFETSLTPDTNTSFVITEPTSDAGTARPVVVHVSRIAPQP